MSAQIKERPILFSGAMVRALIDGTKTQTRRAITMPASWDCIVYADYGDGWWPYRSDDGESPNYDNNEIPMRCPYGQPGDRLWVRETWAQPAALDPGPTVYRADYPACVPAGFTNLPKADEITWKPSIHMFRKDSRILLEVVSVRVERLQDIGDRDSRAEGVTIEDRHMGGYCAGQFLPPAVRAYRELWEQINGAGSWDANPWVWVVEFKRVMQ